MHTPVSFIICLVELELAASFILGGNSNREHNLQYCGILSVFLDVCLISLLSFYLHGYNDF